MLFTLFSIGSSTIEEQWYMKVNSSAIEVNCSAIEVERILMPTIQIKEHKDLTIRVSSPPNGSSLQQTIL